MTLSEVIKTLQTIEEEQGDIDVYLEKIDDYGDYYISSVEEIEHAPRLPGIILRAY